MPEPSTEGTERSQRWLKIGWELEGSWRDSSDAVARRAAVKIHGDGSVNARYNASDAHQYPDRWSGEVVSREPYQRLAPCLAAMMKVWPDAVNESCGFHVHVSFNTGDYSALTNPAFFTYFTEKWKEWGAANCGRDGASTEQEFWNRLLGRNRFCLPNFNPDSQMPQREKRESRYAQLNYCWGRYKTIECRMLPMFNNRDLAPLAVKHLLWIYESWLDAHPTEDTGHSIEAPDEPSVHVVDATEEAVVELTSAADEEIELDDGQLSVLTTSAELMVGFKDAKRTQLELAKRLAKKYPDLAQLLRSGDV